jgi:hypothetical protein
MRAPPSSTNTASPNVAAVFAARHGEVSNHPERSRRGGRAQFRPRSTGFNAVKRRVLLSCRHAVLSFACTYRAAADLARAVTTTHVQVVVFENHAYNQVIGRRAAPYLNSLANTFALMTNSFAVAHPSEPNYLALFSGSTQGITSDICPVNFNGPDLGGELLSHGNTFVGYAESMPSNGYTGCSSGEYARKHNPWVDFKDVPASDNVVYPGPLTSAPSSVTFIVPNLCDDMHDCSVATGDAWAKKNLPALITWDEANGGVAIITFDEDDSAHGNHIATILAGNVNPGKYSQKINHYNVLRTIENLFGLPAINKTSTALPISGVIR